MAQQPNADLITKITTSAAETFTDAYYTALQAARRTLSSYYVAKETFPDDQVVPSITWNGNVFNDANDYQRMWEEQMPSYSYFEVQCLDCQVLNPNPPQSKEEKAAASQVDASESRPAGVTAKKGKKDEEHIITSMLVTVNGFVRLEERSEGPQRGFSEVFILVPNMDVTKANEGKRWLIQTQNFRYVV
ncbi:uncharacterized protein K452DRAFT_287662 [Aplosporella prunicola CBS 121167]|uniref:NTF2 domain-containing protein n=1 Tax=Aplosporella prunicola CBS 121167 TaxID=1176127 RepID=A0A6A6BFK8_9PEZI|nr:uncharacterized protein K452DRAFT_287662 [Aplosporella prunicola CBS 121167]KAF2141707.1 hypothetical protein K452DRAFT_287662 [Aplosporella prunicola CBS 121167]